MIPNNESAAGAQAAAEDLDGGSFTYNSGKFSLGAMYLKGDETLTGDAKGCDDDGFVPARTGRCEERSWQLGPHWPSLSQGAPTTIGHTMNGAYDKFEKEGFKGYMAEPGSC